MPFLIFLSLLPFVTTQMLVGLPSNQICPQSHPFPADGGLICCERIEGNGTCAGGTDPCEPNNTSTTCASHCPEILSRGPLYCPMEYPYRFSQGCCKQNREANKPRLGAHCNGSVLSPESICCLNDEAVQCPFQCQCSSNPNATEKPSDTGGTSTLRATTPKASAMKKFAERLTQLGNRNEQGVQAPNASRVVGVKVKQGKKRLLRKPIDLVVRVKKRNITNRMLQQKSMFLTVKAKSKKGLGNRQDENHHNKQPINLVLHNKRTYSSKSNGQDSEKNLKGKEESHDDAK